LAIHQKPAEEAGEHSGSDPREQALTVRHWLISLIANLFQTIDWNSNACLRQKQAMNKEIK
jgi:hypothetical protein